MSARSIAGALVAAALAAAVPATYAQEAADKKPDKPAGAMPMMPKPAAEISALSFFDGNWTCTGQGAMEPGAPMTPMTSTVTSRKDLGGFWQSGTVKGTTPGMPP